MSNEIETTVKKCSRLGWHAETMIHLKENDYFVVSTCRRYSGISTSGRVMTITESMRTFSIFGGEKTFSMRHSAKRATEKVILQLHMDALNHSDLKSMLPRAKSAKDLKQKSLF